jgi:hypothetical protein
MSQDAQRREEELRRKVADVERKIGAFSGRLMFSDELGGLAGRQSRLDDLAASLEKARTRGYRYSAYLEPTLAAARSAAKPAIEAARAEADATGRALRSRVDDAAATRAVATGSISNQAHHVDGLGARPRRWAAASQAEQRITSAARPFCEPFDAVEGAARRAEGARRWLTPLTWCRRRPRWHGQGDVARPPSGRRWRAAPARDHRLRFEQREAGHQTGC